MLTVERGDHPLASGEGFAHSWEVKLCSCQPRNVLQGLCVPEAGFPYSNSTFLKGQKAEVCKNKNNFPAFSLHEFLVNGLLLNAQDFPKWDTLYPSFLIQDTTVIFNKNSKNLKFNRKTDGQK